MRPTTDAWRAGSASDAGTTASQFTVARGATEAGRGLTGGTRRHPRLQPLQRHDRVVRALRAPQLEARARTGDLTRLFAGLVDRQAPSVDVGTVHGAHRDLALVVRGELHEPEPTGLARLPVDEALHALHGAEPRERITQRVLGRGVVQIPYIQSSCHSGHHYTRNSTCGRSKL